MYRCNCCYEETEAVGEYKLPYIGYGSLFDSCEEEIKFYLDPQCIKKINIWLKKNLPGINLQLFWECRKVEFEEDGHTLEKFEYEIALWRVFHKFMPDVIYHGDLFTYYKVYWLLIGEWLIFKRNFRKKGQAN